MGRVLPLAMAAAMAAPLAWASPASASPLSSGCTYVNSLTPNQFSGFSFPESFFAGERVTFTAAPPSTNGTPSQVFLSIDGTLVDATTFPGAVSYTFPANATVRIEMKVNDFGGNPTWSFRCDVPPPDTAPPTVTVNQASTQSDPATALPVKFTVVFSEPVSGFTASDIVLGGTALPSGATVTGGPRIYSVAVPQVGRAGTVTASVAAGAATDRAGNSSVASTSTDNTVSFGFSCPSVCR
jgi:serine protease AprX